MQRFKSWIVKQSNYFNDYNRCLLACYNKTYISANYRLNHKSKYFLSGEAILMQSLAEICPKRLRNIRQFIPELYKVH